MKPTVTLLYDEFEEIQKNSVKYNRIKFILQDIKLKFNPVILHHNGGSSGGDRVTTLTKDELNRLIDEIIMVG